MVSGGSSAERDEATDTAKKKHAKSGRASKGGASATEYASEAAAINAGGAGGKGGTDGAESANGDNAANRANGDYVTGDNGGDGGDGDAERSSSQADDLAAERDKYLRLAAEYDNYRKRSSKEMQAAYSDARADAITRLLPVYDNIERALNTDCSDEPFYKGVEMIMAQMEQILEGFGVKPIQAVGEVFDPNRHNAVMAVENPDFGENVVAEEFQKGFTLGDKVIRFSTVVVANPGQ